MKRTVLSLIAMAAMAAPAFAASQNANLNVTASVAANCTITTSPVAFGAYDPVSANAAANLTASGSDFMNYSLFKDAALTQAWGTGIAGGTTSAYNAATKNVTAVTVFGMVPAAQDVTVGAYADVVVATINY